MIYSDTINNVEFEAYYDEKNRALHVLDAMGSKPRLSVTNGIDNLIPALERLMKINNDYKIFLYGTDGIISRYNALTKEFIFVPKESPSVFYEFREKMEILYETDRYKAL
jgi:hypothetical protein